MNALKRIVFFFLILEIASPMEMPHLLTAVPAFIEHYQHHNSEHHRVSFSDFVVEHFTGEESHHADSKHPEHDHCPMSHDHHTFVAFQAMMPADSRISFLFTALPDTSEKTLFNHDFSVASYAGTIWQPPRLA